MAKVRGQIAGGRISTSSLIISADWLDSDWICSDKRAEMLSRPMRGWRSPPQ